MHLAITKNLLDIPEGMFHFDGGHDLMNVGSGGINAVVKAKHVDDTSVHLHAEMPLVAFSGLLYFRRSEDSVVLVAFVSGGTGR